MKTILIAGATGNIGSKTLRHLLAKPVQVRVVLRKQSDRRIIDGLVKSGVDVREIDMNDIQQMTEACTAVDCVVSLLSGLRDVIIDTQRTLLDAAVAARVPRFIPSDFSLDFRNLVKGNNRNLDLRKEFYSYINLQPIKATSIFNGALIDLLKTDMPLILKKQRRILCWGNRDRKMEFTHTEDIAAFTANVCLDDTSPRHLFIAGSVLSCNDFVKLMTDITDTRYKILRPGGIGLLNSLIKMARFFAPGKGELYPAWQGMQYMRDMMEGRTELPRSYANNRYDKSTFKTVKEFLLDDNWVQE
jgi:nucleoside-diphosphate-sugar epimerase